MPTTCGLRALEVAVQKGRELCQPFIFSNTPETKRVSPYSYKNDFLKMNVTLIHENLK